MKIKLLLIITTLFYLSFAKAEFKLMEGQSCQPGGANPPTYCEATQPKGWATEEAQELMQLLEPLKSKRLECFLKKIEINGYNNIYRYGYGAFNKSPDPHSDTWARNDRNSAWVRHFDKSINIADKFFQIHLATDPISGYEIKKMIVLHELAHAFDTSLSYSNSPEFLSLVGYSKNENGIWQISGINMTPLNEATKKWLDLNLEGKEAEGYSQMRRVAIEQGFPTTYGLSNPTELFADILSHLFYDPKAKDYIRPDIINWYETNVFSCKQLSLTRSSPKYKTN